MRHTPLNDSRNLEIAVYGNTHLDRSWFRRFDIEPNVAKDYFDISTAFLIHGVLTVSTPISPRLSYKTHHAEIT
jgi:hypothetical protein